MNKTSSSFQNKKKNSLLKKIDSKIPNKNHHSIETFIEATRNEIQKKNRKSMTIEICDTDNQRAESNAVTAICKRQIQNRCRQKLERCNPRCGRLH